MITMRIDDAAFQREVRAFIKKKDGEFKRILLDATLTMVKLAKTRVRNLTRGAKVRTGFLVNGIGHIITSNGFTGIVESKAKYSQAYEDGTRPHHIRVKNKAVLAGPLRGAPAGWDVSKKSKKMGYATYGKTVQHPGTKPHPFMFPAWKFATQKLEDGIRRAL